MDTLIGKLMQNNIAVHRARADFVADDRAYADGDYVVSLAQPNGALVRSLLEEASWVKPARRIYFQPYPSN